jgi:shikimate dehydrogenase
MQNAGINELGLEWRYLAFDVHPLHLREAILGAKVMKFIGLNLTVPHKLLAVDMVDALDESALTFGAVNTVRFEAKDENGEWQPLRHFEGDVPEVVRSHGFNTDADALGRALREGLKLDLPRSRVLLLGAGGAGRAAALKLASERVHELYLVNRTAQKAEGVAKEIRERFPQVNVVLGYPKETVDLVLNATSLGLKPEDELPFDAKQFALDRTKSVYDMIYRPAETRLLMAAKEAGCAVANGLGMLLYQGAAALELWTGQQAPLAVMKQALEQEVYGGGSKVAATFGR